jgi:hypothetical protein
MGRVFEASTWVSTRDYFRAIEQAIDLAVTKSVHWTTGHPPTHFQCKEIRELMLAELLEQKEKRG